jgi:hypothetical protein
MDRIDTFPYLPRIEWQDLTCFESVGAPTGSSPFPASTSDVRVRHTDEHVLEGVAVGEFEKDEFRRYREAQDSRPAGATTRGERVETVGPHGSVVLDGCFVKNIRAKTEVVSGVMRTKFEITFGLHRASWNATSPEHMGPSWLTDWFLNGPHDHVYRRASSRSGETRYGRKWAHEEREHMFLGQQGGPAALDHFRVETDVASFVVHLVPDGFGPPWSRNIGVEYRPRGGILPDAEVRESVGELLGFILGRRLLPLGTTAFAEAGFPIEVVARQLWGEDGRTVCAKPDLSPLAIEMPRGGRNVEDVLAALLPRYLELRSALRLGDVLWRLWLGNEASLGIDLPIFSAGLDMLAAEWFKSSRSRSRGVYMEKSAFDRLLADAFRLIEERLRGVEYAERILRRIKGAFQAGQAERTEWFFEEIGLPLGRHERAAMKARNAPAHGGGGGSEEEIRELIQHGAAYRTLYARTILKLLGYSGRYLDRRTLTFPERELQVPAGGE